MLSLRKRDPPGQDVPPRSIRAGARRRSGSDAQLIALPAESGVTRSLDPTGPRTHHAGPKRRKSRAPRGRVLDGEVEVDDRAHPGDIEWIAMRGLCGDARRK